MLAALINGTPILERDRAISIEERGLSYGDGVFETMLVKDGNIRHWDDHWERLQAGCERLGIASPDKHVINNDFRVLLEGSKNGVAKLIVTRGSGGRGYRAAENLEPTRLAMLYPPPTEGPHPIRARWCATKLSRNPLLAGIKHLNRLEQVLAQNEWRDASIAEGLMVDTEGEVVSGTSSNLFVVNDGVVSTPDLRFCGVLGVMRRRVIKCALALGLEVRQCSLWREDIVGASELFITNAVRGIRPIVMLDEQRWEVGGTTMNLIAKVEQDG